MKRNKDFVSHNPEALIDRTPEISLVVQQLKQLKRQPQMKSAASQRLTR